MGKLYTVEIEYELQVWAESPEEAKSIGKRVIAEGEESPADVFASETKAVSDEWANAIPWANDYSARPEMTCAEILTAPTPTKGAE